MLNYGKIFADKSVSVFDNMDRLSKLITEAEGDDEEQSGGEEENAGGEDAGGDAGQAPDDGGGDAAPPDAGNAPQDPNAGQEQGNPAQEDTGVYVSSNELASFAKTIMDALQASPPKAGEIPQEYLTVTDQNANNVIKFVQAWLRLDLNNSLKDTGSKGSFTDQMKHI